MSLFLIQTRIRTRLAMRAKGLGFWEINEAMSGFTDDLVEEAAKVGGVAIPAGLMVADGAVGALGDGTILQAIIDFFKSPAGQALIQALLALLIGLI